MTQKNISDFSDKGRKRYQNDEKVKEPKSVPKYYEKANTQNSD